MSSDKQNPRSPDQQEAEIRRRIATLGYPWRIVKVYRDDGVSGRYNRNRPGFQQMLRDIRTGAIKVDLILVDTLERAGRTEDLPAIRKELREQHGVLVLTADSGFADPTTPQGQAFGAFEAMRATEENRIKAYQVKRGKRDLACRGFWPGGPPPFGYRLVTRATQLNGRQVVEGSVLDPHPEEAPIIQRIFERADATGHGGIRLANHFNAAPEIPERFKPFSAPTISYWLKHEIYMGELVWNQNSTDVVDDTRVIEPNSEDEWLRVPNFCEPLVSPDVWKRVEAGRVRRRKSNAKGDARGGKQIAPLAPGLSLRYLLSGLARCGECGAAMRAVTSGRKSRAGKRYVYYVCPTAIEGGDCGNKKSIPEDWLRRVVIDHLKSQLFPNG